VATQWFRCKLRRALIALRQPVSNDTVTKVPTDAEIDAFIRRAGIDRTWDRIAAMIS
jgi:hypothetical protein